jgi:CheY-like chemotaxis protein
MTSPSPVGRPIYGIGAVSRMLGLPAATIRNWEDRYGVVAPARSPGGQRLYSRDDVDRLRLVRDEVAAGASPAAAHRLLADRLAADRPVMEPDPDAPGLLALVAERDPHSADLVEHLLRAEGIAVEVATTGEAALEAFAATAPALVIVELMLDGGRGLAVCSELRARGAGAILAISGLRIRDEALAAGADAFLLKPFDPLALVAAAKDLLSRSATLRELGGVPS